MKARARVVEFGNGGNVGVIVTPKVSEKYARKLAQDALKRKTMFNRELWVTSKSEDRWTFYAHKPFVS